MDLREDWGADLIHLLLEWDYGASPPLRMSVEFVLSALTWLGLDSLHALRREDTSLARKGPNVSISDWEFDWARIRSPFLGAPSVEPRLDSPIERLVYFGWVWEPGDSVNVSTATKADDAEVNLGLWNVGGDGPGMERARSILRDWLHSRWRRATTRDAVRWLHNQGVVDGHEQWQRNRDAIADCVTRAANSTWWEWSDGSRLFFWRWPILWRLEARDGAKSYRITEPPPRRHFPRVPVEEPWIIEKDNEKLQKLIVRRYIVPGTVHTVVPRFPVKKGEDDIRVVWDLTKNGLNPLTFTPSFFLPTASSYVRRLEAGMAAGDFDIGEQFHNYPLHVSEQSYCGVDLPMSLVEEMRAKGLVADRFMRWVRLVFGWQSSPYFALRMHVRGLELAMGSPLDTASAFQWARVELNLPGSPNYNPAIPRVRKVRLDGLTAVDMVSFFDDGRVFGPTQTLVGFGLRQVTSRIQTRGNQDAARKRRSISLRPGAWAGCIAYTDQGIVRRFTSQAKWDKAKRHIQWIQDHLRHGLDMERGTFKSCQGFLVHMSSTYEEVKPYIHGLFLAENSWRENRDSEGYRRRTVDDGMSLEPSPEEDSFEDEEEAMQVTGALGGDSMLALPAVVPSVSPPRPCEGVPKTVAMVPRLQSDMDALEQIFMGATPIQVIERPVAGARCLAFGGGDASGEGFGSLISPLDMPPLLRRGFWDVIGSSNWREMRNLLEAIREEARLGRLVGFDVWLTTDNSTAEASFYKGRSSSPELDAMILELRLLAIAGNFVVHLVHIAGTRMIELGIDALSRGELHLGALADATVARVIPLHLHPLERSEGLSHWLSLWIPSYEVASPEDWFYNAHEGGRYDIPTRPLVPWIWTLPPAAALIALEELGNARLKRHDLLRGVVLVPSLLRPEWFRRFRRCVDFYFFVPAGSILGWPSSMHEPLTVGIFLPLLRFSPWDWKRVRFLVSFGLSLSAMHKAGDPSTGDLLREFWDASSWIARMPERLVRDLLLHPSWRRFLDISRDRRERE